MEEPARDQPPVLAVSSIAGPFSAKSLTSRLLAEPANPIDPLARNATAQTMMIPHGHPRVAASSSACCGPSCAACAHSGQRMPTGVGVMQSGQIGRPHDEQETPVTRLGWR